MMGATQVLALGLGVAPPWRLVSQHQETATQPHEVQLRLDPERTDCPTHGVKRVSVPWARDGSGFTLLYEQVALMLVREMPVQAAARQMAITDQRLWRIVGTMWGRRWSGSILPRSKRGRSNSGATAQNWGPFPFSPYLTRISLSAATCTIRSSRMGRGWRRCTWSLPRAKGDW